MAPIMAARVGVRQNAVTSGPLVSDTFTRANSASTLGNAETGQTWTAVNGTWGITSNAAYIAATGAGDQIVTVPAAADSTTTATYSALVSTNSATRLIFRYSDSSNYWLLQAQFGSSPGYYLYKKVAGGFTQMAVYATTCTSADVAKIVASGSSVAFYINGTLRGSVSDAFNSSATVAGFGTSGTTVTGTAFDNFLVTVP